MATWTRTPTLPPPESRMLGKLPPARRDTVDITQFLRPEAVTHPVANPAPVLHYPMDHNDQVGDCVVAGLDHTLQVIASALGQPRVNWPDNVLLELYRTQNPNFHNWNQGGTDADGGMVIQTFLEELVRRGEILAFGAVNHNDMNVLEAACYVGLAVVTGEELRVAQQNQTTWDYVKGSGDWGGHCTCTVGYKQNENQSLVTWGELIDMTPAFVSNQLDESWLVLTQSMVNNPSFRAGFDAAGFAAAVKELTNGKVIVPVTPVPPAPPVPPTPPPAPPVPNDIMADFPWGPVDAWLAHNPRHDEGYNRAAKSAMGAWFAAHDLRPGGAGRPQTTEIFDAYGRRIGLLNEVTGRFIAAQSE